MYYYNENLQTVWVYSDKVSGTLTALSPSSAAPTSITVTGTEYELGTSTAIYKCSSQGEFSTGDVVTLLLGRWTCSPPAAPAPARPARSTMER